MSVNPARKRPEFEHVTSPGFPPSADIQEATAAYDKSRQRPAPPDYRKYASSSKQPESVPTTDIPELLRDCRELINNLVATVHRQNCSLPAADCSYYRCLEARDLHWRITHALTEIGIASVPTTEPCPECGAEGDEWHSYDCPNFPPAKTYVPSKPECSCHIESRPGYEDGMASDCSVHGKPESETEFVGSADELATLVAALQAELARLRGALEPFAEARKLMLREGFKQSHLPDDAIWDKAVAALDSEGEKDG